MLTSTDQSIKVKRRERPWSDVDNRVFFDHRLSLDTRLMLAWMLGRSDGFVIMVEPMRRWFALSPKVWKRVKKELIVAGYYIQTRSKGASGKILWTHEISDDPLDDVQFPWNSAPPSTIPPKGQDGETILPKGIDGKSIDAGGIDAQSRDNNKEVYESEKNNNNSALVVMRFADGSELGGVPSDWADDLRSEVEQRGATNKAKSAYAIGVLNNWRKAGKPTLSRSQPTSPSIPSTAVTSVRTERCPPTPAFLQQAAKLKHRKAAISGEAS